MPIATRTFRVFVSSTFEDLVEERNALQREVFPKLSKVCEDHGARFQAIDLRWGVRDEAVLGQQMMEICLVEIERCQRTGIKPNFIVLLGDRYGRPPLPARIPAQEFETVVSRIGSAEDRVLVENWYQRDDNAVPAEYLLKPRTGDFMHANRWTEVEHPLREVLRGAARAAGLSNDALLKYEGSASHQEIVKGLGTTPEDRSHVFAFFRATDGAKESVELRNLKRFLRGQLGENVFDYEAGDIENLCKRVRASLESVMLDEISRFESRPALEQEKEAHRTFARDRYTHFVGREAVLGEIQKYLDGSDARPLVVRGPSGSGKSAIIARASEYREGIRRFIGATPESSSGLRLLRSLCEEIGEQYGQAVDLSATFNELTVLFQHLLRLAIANHPLILYIDALDQLGEQDSAAAMDWLPHELPPHCRVVLSTTEIHSGLAIARLVDVERFSIQEAGETLDLWFKDARRTLRRDQREKLLESFKRIGLPLYLKLAFEESRLWRSFDPVDKCVLGDGLPGIIDQLFGRLSDPGNHGQLLVSHALGYLVAARDGLTDGEMLGVLAANDDVWADFERANKHDLPEYMAETRNGKRQLPVIVWSRLYLDLEPYLAERAVRGGTTISFYHRQLADRVPRRSFHHSGLAKYFAEQLLWLGPMSPNERKLRELAYQQGLARMDDELRETLGNLDFLEAKSFAAMEYDLLMDCERATAFIPAAGILKAAMSRIVVALRARPEHILQTLYNHLVWIVGEYPALSCSLEHALKTLDARGPWLQLESKPAYEASAGYVSYRMPFGSAVQAVVPEADLLAFARYDGTISAHRLSTGQELFTRSLLAGNVAGISLSIADRSVAYVDRKGTIGVEQSRLTLAGRRGEYLVYHDGRWVLAAREDHALVAWCTEDGYMVVLERGLPLPLTVLRPSMSGKVLCVAGVRDQRVGIISMSAEGGTYARIPYLGSQILDADLDAGEERIVAACADRHIRILNASTGSEVWGLAYERQDTPTVTGRPERCCFGRGSMAGLVVFSTADAQIASWDWKTGKVEVILSDVHEGGLHSYYMLRGLDSGKLLATRLEDVKLLGTSVPVRSEASHQRQVTSVDILDTGKVVSFSAGDRSLVWHSSNGGAPESRRNVVNATAMAVLSGTNDVVVADSRGAVWKQRPEGSPPAEGTFCSEGAVAMCAVGSGLVAIGAATGGIFCVDPEAKFAQLVRSPVWGLRQIALTPAGGYGVCWAREVVTVTGGMRTVLALVTHFGKERCKLRVEAHAVATGDGGSTVCYADPSGVHVLRRRLLRFLPAYEKSVKASQLAVLGSSALLAVTRADENWLEIWRLKQGLPVAMAAELPDNATCIAARGERIAVGLSSGDVLWFRVRKASRNS